MSRSLKCTKRSNKLDRRLVRPFVAFACEVRRAPLELPPMGPPPFAVLEVLREQREVAAETAGTAAGACQPRGPKGSPAAGCKAQQRRRHRVPREAHIDRASPLAREGARTREKVRSPD
mmetsp:Transcript_105821/g.304100  ORF Transcript_105821/g.304100 Transcript_105821/m.304100 type:complete len:119 (+) Transcript_105821:425-781(+)